MWLAGRAVWDALAGLHSAVKARPCSWQPVCLELSPSSCQPSCVGHACLGHPPAPFPAPRSLATSAVCLPAAARRVSSPAPPQRPPACSADSGRSSAGGRRMRRPGGRECLARPACTALHTRTSHLAAPHGPSPTAHLLPSAAGLAAVPDHVQVQARVLPESLARHASSTSLLRPARPPPAGRFGGGDWHADQYETAEEYAQRIWEEMQVGGVAAGTGAVRMGVCCASGLRQAWPCVGMAGTERGWLPSPRHPQPAEESLPTLLHVRMPCRGCRRTDEPRSSGRARPLHSAGQGAGRGRWGRGAGGPGPL